MYDNASFINSVYIYTGLYVEKVNCYILGYSQILYIYKNICVYTCIYIYIYIYIQDEKSAIESDNLKDKRLVNRVYKHTRFICEFLCTIFYVENSNLRKIKFSNQPMCVENFCLIFGFGLINSYIGPLF